MTLSYETLPGEGAGAVPAAARGGHDRGERGRPPIVVSPDYRRAPEAVFPVSHDDVLAAYRWTVQHAAEPGGDATRIGIDGASVGGNMAPATVLALLQAGEALPVAQVCAYPVTTGDQFGESMADAADARPLNRALLSWMAMHAFEGVPDAKIVDATDAVIRLTTSNICARSTPS